MWALVAWMPKRPLTRPPAWLSALPPPSSNTPTPAAPVAPMLPALVTAPLPYRYTPRVAPVMVAAAPTLVTTLAATTETPDREAPAMIPVLATVPAPIR